MIIDENALPSSWAYTALGVVCKLRNGYAFKSDKYIKGEGVPVIRISDIGEGKVDLSECVKVKAHEDYEPYELYTGDILVAMSGATTGKFGIYNSIEKAYQNQRVGMFQIKELDILNNSFLLYLLYGLKRRILEDAYGGAQPNISSGKIEEMLVPLPPLPEQHRIVAKIEELFSSLDKGIEALKTAQAQLKVYRQAVLKYAFEGRLTHPNLEQGKLPEGWVEKRISSICNKIQDGSHFSPQVQYTEGGNNRFMYITAKNIRPGRILLENITWVDKDFHESIYSRCNPEYGDVLLTKDGVNTGDVALNVFTEEITLLSSICLFKTDKRVLSPQYLMYFLQSPLGSAIIKSSMTGTAIKRIILRKLREAEMILPPLSEQDEVINQIESRLSACDRIEESIEKSLQQTEALRQSILKKAFEGKLIPQDPNDEPASALLERIKLERENSKPQKSTKTLRKK